MKYQKRAATNIAIVLATVIAGVFLYAAYGTPADVVSVTLEDGLSREEIAAKFAVAYAWPPERQEEFSRALYGIQWDAFNDELAEIMAREYGWGGAEREEFLIRGASFSEPEFDLLAWAYVPDTYVFPPMLEPSQVAAILVDRVAKKHADASAFLETILDEDVRVRIAGVIKQSVSALLPDLIPYPPQSIGLRTSEEGRVLLVFDTTYYNIGRGAFELVADPMTAGIAADIERKIFQRIYQRDGMAAQQRLVGTFLWHEEHLHYHFSDFVEYRLEYLDDDVENSPYRVYEKQTFCVRDVSRIDGISQGEARYLVCGKNRQGVSVGWGDTYFHTYGSQNFDITAFPSGRYKLSFIVNPENKFEEVSRENNIASAIIVIAKEAGTVKAGEYVPPERPGIEHVNKEQ